jgi:AcrR family transcriptional regulator
MRPEPMPDVAGPPVDPQEPPVDGRIARGVRSRRRVAEALVVLLKEGNPQPTAKEIADRAGVSRRLVFHHFDDLDDLYRSVAAMQAERYWQEMRPVPPEWPRGRRVARIVRQRAAVYESIGHVRRAAARHAHRSPGLALQLNHANTELRRWMAVAFAPEVTAAGARGPDLLEGLDLLTSWEAWDRLRSAQGLSPRAARQALIFAMEALLVTAERDETTAAARPTSDRSA